MDRDGQLLIVCVVQFFCIMFLVFALCNAITRYEAATISHHAAHYDGQTGKFTWNDEVPK